MYLAARIQKWTDLHACDMGNIPKKTENGKILRQKTSLGYVTTHPKKMKATRCLFMLKGMGSDPNTMKRLNLIFSRQPRPPLT